MRERGREGETDPSGSRPKGEGARLGTRGAPRPATAEVRGRRHPDVAEVVDLALVGERACKLEEIIC